MSEEHQVLLYSGDVLKSLRSVEDSRYSAIITDPPYGLSGDPDMEEVVKHWLSGDDQYDNGRGFKGQEWDTFVPGPSVWKELYRCSKPGAIMLVYCGTRTSDLMGVSVRLGGWKKFDEIDVYGGLDQMAWIYSTSMPKSHNISRLAAKNGDTDTASTWSGYGTTLNPAHEVIMVFRKPREGTFLENATTYGTGMLNIQNASIPTFGSDKENHLREWDRMQSEAASQSIVMNSGLAAIDLSGYKMDGRWPKNVVFSEWDENDVFESPTRQLDEQSEHSSSKRANRGAGINGNLFKSPKYISEVRGHNDSGSKARFFYVNKSSRKERSAGLCKENLHPTVKPITLSTYLAKLLVPPDKFIDDAVIAVPFGGSGSEVIGAALAGWKNIDMFELSMDYIVIAVNRFNWWLQMSEKLNTNDPQEIVKHGDENVRD